MASVIPTKIFVMDNWGKYKENVNCSNITYLFNPASFQEIDIGITFDMSAYVKKKCPIQ